MLSFMSYLYILDINSLIVISFANIFPFIRLYFCLDGVLSCAKAFGLIRSHFLKLVQHCHLWSLITVCLVSRFYFHNFNWDCISYMSHSDDFTWVTFYAPIPFLVKNEVGKIILKISVHKEWFCFRDHIKKIITVIL